MEDKYKRLRDHIEEISDLTDEEWDFLSKHFKYKSFKKHQYLIQIGQTVPSEFWIINGLVKSFTVDNDGKEHILQFGMEDYWVSDYNAYQNQIKSTLHVDCLEDSEFFSLSFENREIICQEVKAMANFFRVKANLGYIALQKRILSHLTETAEERYNNLLTTLPKLIQRVPKKLLAAYLGVSRETLSRLKV
ncbi:Crp/Fnr family transcriptional regulator [Fulvivirga sp. RKSG066]|uniref:Crp/Fnr family transcriptional regulator n=1 Tax=Fulvivirga aurantia TaxID=2529383 RepID=UPI0012BD2FFC|nr:Crp/Fnr family transcriptional regulator [Fulvivirga aurantia]MTI19501.1 Crp/Fnr family transcriptional regulator [Fulvivirga aurantia]